jgi:hypothetical protein
VKTNILSAFCFIVFLTSGLLVAVSGRFLSAGTRPRVRNVFLLVVLLISFGAGLTQHNLWPFSSWPVLAYPVSTGGNYVPLPRIMGVDFSGSEYDIDYRARRPLALEELLSWIKLHFAHLDPAARDSVGAFLLRQSNLAREEALSSAGLPYPNRWFGPLTAPTHMLHPAIWSHRETVPRNAFVELRIYQESWNLEERHRDPQKVTRVLVFSYRQR